MTLIKDKQHNGYTYVAVEIEEILKPIGDTWIEE